MIKKRKFLDVFYFWLARRISWRLRYAVWSTLGPRCNDCGRPYGDEYGFPDLVVPDEVWDQIHERSPGGLLCPSCMCFRAHKLGLENVSSSFKSGPFCRYD